MRKETEFIRNNKTTTLTSLLYFMNLILFNYLYVRPIY